MLELTTLNVEKREKVGKGAARATRRAGLVPGVIYGDKKAPVLIALSPKELDKEMNTKGLWTRQFEIHVGKEKYRALCHDIQKHPVTDRPIHVDFLRISKDSDISVDVHVAFINEEACPGIKHGGVLNIVRRAVEISCKPDDIPQEFVVDLKGLQIGDTIKTSDLDMPKGVKPSEDRDFTIATIAAPTVVKEDTEETAEGEEEAVETSEEDKE